jgi:hypothetical protein
MGHLKVQRFGVEFSLGVGNIASESVKSSQLFWSQRRGEDAGSWFSQLTRRENPTECYEG